MRVCNLFYAKPVLMKTFYAAMDVLKVPLSGIFEEWSRWEGTLKPGERRVLSCMESHKFYSGLCRLAPGFFRHLCGVFAKASAYGRLVPSLQEAMFQLTAISEFMRQKGAGESARYAYGEDRARSGFTPHAHRPAGVKN
jgi:hypothetical protein